MKFPIPHPKITRRWQERFWVTLVLILILFFGFLEGWFFQLQSELPLFGNIFLFALINLNVILLLLLTYLVLRNIVKLIFERKRNILGHKLRTRLVIAFVGLTLIPTLPLFWLATQFIFSSLDYWFSHRVEQSLEQSVALAKDYLEQEKHDLVSDSRILQEELHRLQKIRTSQPPEEQELPPSLLVQHHLEGIFLTDLQGKILRQSFSTALSAKPLELLDHFDSREIKASPEVQHISLKQDQEGLVSRVEFQLSSQSSETTAGILILVRILPPGITQELKAITAGYEDYLQLKMLHSPLKKTHFITFSSITLLVIFAAIWFGFTLAKNITTPIQALVSATQRVADGDFNNVELASDRQDEIGMLMTSFNAMVGDLRASRGQLAKAYKALQQSNWELEDRRRYMEIVLRDIAAGVVSVDETGKIMTMNKSAEAVFGLRASETLGRFYSEFLQPTHFEILQSFRDKYLKTRQNYFQQHIQVMMGSRPRVFLIKVSVLRDEEDRYMGVVVVLDDLTDLEKAQRMAAWREVARRIAHEIKNPLTPIRLCAQRLRRRYLDQIQEDRSPVFDECTATIIEQVDRMKHLVDEFSKFARLPRVQLAPCNPVSIIEEGMALYKHTTPNVSFFLEREGNIPVVPLDRDQFKQVMINLLENAIHALDDREGSITLRLFHDPDLKIVRLECADTGHGISHEDKLRMFEPYYSTKEKGTGLGLAIVASIVADHNGFVRVCDNIPRGTVIIIELPG
jgi:two-component system nitrogen regulation sensor histidine kinase NtrY